MLGAKMKPDEFTAKCFPVEMLTGRMSRTSFTSTEGTDDLMRAPDFWNLDGEQCLLVAKRGNATGTTLSRANGISSIVRNYASTN